MAADSDGQSSATNCGCVRMPSSYVTSNCLRYSASVCRRLCSVPRVYPPPIEVLTSRRKRPRYLGLTARNSENLLSSRA
jgi:hypothetical protein